MYDYFVMAPAVCYLTTVTAI